MTMLVETTYFWFQIKQEENRTERNREGPRTKEGRREEGGLDSCTRFSLEFILAIFLFMKVRNIGILMGGTEHDDRPSKVSTT